MSFLIKSLSESLFQSSAKVVKFIDISQNFVAFSEYMKFKKDLQLLGCQSNDKALTKLRICQKWENLKGAC